MGSLTCAIEAPSSHGTLGLSAGAAPVGAPQGSDPADRRDVPQSQDSFSGIEAQGQKEQVRKPK